MLDFSEARKCSPTKCFSTVRPKNWRRIVMPTPFLIQKKHFSISKSFWSTKGFLYEIFRYCEPKKLTRFVKPARSSTENGVACSLLLSPTFFAIRNWRNSRGFPCKSLRHCETKRLRRRFVMLPQSPAPPSYSWFFFRFRKFSSNTERFLYEMFR